MIEVQKVKNEKIMNCNHRFEFWSKSNNDRYWYWIEFQNTNIYVSKTRFHKT